MTDTVHATGDKKGPLRVLHLEDSIPDHLLTCNALERSGLVFEIERVDTLHEYCLKVTGGRFDVVLADYHLPSFNALDAWQSTPKAFRGAFILLSGAIGESAAVEAILRGVSDYVHKDELYKLSRVIQRSLEVQRIAQEKAATDLELLDSKKRLAQFANHLQESIEEERTAIAREIHDDIGGSLAAVKLDLAWISRRARDEGIQRHIETASEMLQHALGASQRIMHNLRPAILDQGLVPATQWLAESFERRTGIRTLVVTNQSTQPLSKDIQLAAYRTVQEALTNTSKYSECRNLKLEISDFDGVLTVEVADDGNGFHFEDRKKNNAFGLRGLEERAKSVGGWLDVITEQGKGTTLLLTVPLTSGKAKSGGEHGLD